MTEHVYLRVLAVLLIGLLLGILFYSYRYKGLFQKVYGLCLLVLWFLFYLFAPSSQFLLFPMVLQIIMIFIDMVRDHKNTH